MLIKAYSFEMHEEDITIEAFYGDEIVIDNGEIIEITE